MNQDTNETMTSNRTNLPIQSVNRYPLFLDAISVIFHNVLEGIAQGKPAHMSLSDYSLIPEDKMVIDLSLKGLRSRLSQYEIIDSDSAITSSCILLQHPNKWDIFEEGEFIYNCKTGYFHFLLNSNGALSGIISEFHGTTPAFLSFLVQDFPGNNYQPDEDLFKEMSVSKGVGSREFLSGLYPWSPIKIEVD
jgi:hypothetical protein